MRKHKNKKQLGFTLIELLLVISIISFLSSLIMAVTHSARIKARDKARLIDLIQVRNALELYYANYNHYPVTICAGGDPAAAYWISPEIQGYMLGTCDVVGGPMTAANFNATMLKFMQPVHDPKPDPGHQFSGFWYKSDGKVYKFQLVYSPENLNNYPESFIDQSNCGLPITSEGDCGNPGYQLYPSGGYYQLRAVAVWSPEWRDTFHDE